MKIQIKRIYDDPARGDGFRVLVDRLWPRGVTKERAALATPEPQASLRNE